jgi:hypothetical protein
VAEAATRVLIRRMDERRSLGRESVWSWRPDAGAKSAGDDFAGDGG